MSCVYLRQDVVENMTQAGAEKVMSRYDSAARYRHLDNCYAGEHAIKLHTSKDISQPNNRVVNNLCKYITDTSTGFFIGKPVIYSSQDTAFLEALQDIYDYNDEQDENAELAKKASILGHCYEMLYFDEDGRLRFALVAPDTLWLVYAGGYTEPLAAIRRVVSEDLDGKKQVDVEFWNHSTVWRYRSTAGTPLQLVSKEEHIWGDVPFVEYVNNAERTGDFEGIVTLNDAYNTVQSNTANLFQYNDEAILKITGMGDVDSKDVRKMKEDGAVILEDTGEIDWLTKAIDDTALENFKSRLNTDIHQLSNVPNLADENFAGNASGVAMDYKLWGLEQMRGNKERKFKRGLQRRVELIARILNYQGHQFDYRDIKMQFRPNKPQNLVELAQIFVQLAGEVSLETRLAMLPFIEDVQDEIARLKEEKDADRADFGAYDTVLAQLEVLKHEDAEGDTNPPDNEAPA